MASDQTLIVFDTNKLKKTIEGESDYSKFDPKGDIKRLKEFIEKNNLQDNILIGFSEIILKEYCFHRKNDFELKLDQFKRLHKKMINLENCKLGNLQLPEENFDYGNYIEKKILELFQSSPSKFILMPLKESDYSKIFKRVLERAINHKKPFDENGDRGFKDTIIFESLIEFQLEHEFVKIILYTDNLKDFSNSLSEEFSKSTGKLLDIESNYDLLEQTLEITYRILIKYPKLLEYLKSDYFNAKMEDYVADFFNLGINNFEVTNCCKGIEECSIQDLKNFELEDYLEEIMENFKKVSLEFLNDGKEYTADILFDLSTNEIIGGKYEEKQGVVVI